MSQKGKCKVIYMHSSGEKSTVDRTVDRTVDNCTAPYVGLRLHQHKYSSVECSARHHSIWCERLFIRSAKNKCEWQLSILRQFDGSSGVYLDRHGCQTMLDIRFSHQCGGCEVQTASNQTLNNHKREAQERKRLDGRLGQTLIIYGPPLEDWIVARPSTPTDNR